MLTMTRKKKPNRTAVSTHVGLPPELKQAIEELANENRRPMTTEIIIAIEERLRALGRLPAQPGK